MIPPRPRRGLLNAELAVANAHSGFLEDLVAAERPIAFHAFLEPGAEVQELLGVFETELGVSR